MNDALKTELFGLEMKNPVMSASGTFGFADCYRDFFDPAMMGAIVVKALTPLPRAGNPPPRTCETPSGMLNAIGLENPGLREYMARIAPALKGIGTKLIINVAGSTIEDYVEVAEAVEQDGGADALEINISCPNVKEGGLAFGSSAKGAAKVTEAVRRAVGMPIIMKLTPNVTDIAEVAKACEDEGADAISMINTLLGMSIDVKARKPYLANETGGLSGPAVRPVAVRMVWQTAQKVSIPIIGMGGISSAEDALEFMMAGASAVAVGTAQLADPMAIPRIIEGLSRYVKDEGLASIREIVGAACPGRKVAG
ncbi:MAG TPA: dihydroorotate dehydrogenase [Bacillota bacterium]|nr:dihydroorotate dehydrogenase [Bacillota bacterium]HOH10697.1 dihydroorotate dehydrogenase [Bacillota bacterium]HOS50918.1 dihydroorotate dehydrogenase [Bacillota bacterium]HOY89376.1 dihydroorotate dehydrogenase [Bacillota bacterium]HPI01299.1 dihydroorotate dehydrogenase [Bacillota bacterium]